MLSKNRRIQRKAFSHILTVGKRHNSAHFLMYLARADLNAKSRFSFSVSKKVYKSAVRRNGLRRQGYSIINRHLNIIKLGYLCFFSFKKMSSPAAFSVLEKEVLDLLRVSGVLI